MHKVKKDQTIQVCKHCAQRLGESHLPTCSFVKGSGAAPAVAEAFDPDAPPPQGPGGGPDGPKI